jgi:hypothetical protein
VVRLVRLLELRQVLALGRAAGLAGLAVLRRGLDLLLVFLRDLAHFIEGEGNGASAGGGFAFEQLALDVGGGHGGFDGGFGGSRGRRGGLGGCGFGRGSLGGRLLGRDRLGGWLLLGGGFLARGHNR